MVVEFLFSSFVFPFSEPTRSVTRQTRDVMPAPQPVAVRLLARYALSLIILGVVGWAQAGFSAQVRDRSD